jgi:predicted RNA binding protein YcfA (HicA-like mRNA interferase family)
MVESDGWELVCQSGGQREYWHPYKVGAVIVAGKPGEALKPGTLGSILRQARLKGPRQ